MPAADFQLWLAYLIATVFDALGNAPSLAWDFEAAACPAWLRNNFMAVTAVHSSVVAGSC